MGVPPWWLRGPQDPVARLGDVVSAPSLWQSVTALLVVAGLVSILVLGLRRRRQELAAAGAIGLVLCAALAIVAAGTPKEAGLVFTIAYTSRWGSPAGMWIWLALGWAAAVLLAPRLPAARMSALAPGGAVAAVAAVAAVGAVVAAGIGPDLLERRYEPAAEVADRVRSRLPAGAPVSVEGSVDAFDFQAALVYELRRRGEPVAAPSLAPQFGGQYDGDELAAARVVHMRHGGAAEGGRVVARVPDNPQGGARAPGRPGSGAQRDAGAGAPGPVTAGRPRRKASVSNAAAHASCSANSATAIWVRSAPIAQQQQHLGHGARRQHPDEARAPKRQQVLHGQVGARQQRHGQAEPRQRVGRARVSRGRTPPTAAARRPRA